MPWDQYHALWRNAPSPFVTIPPSPLLKGLYQSQPAVWPPIARQWVRVDHLHRSWRLALILFSQRYLSAVLNPRLYLAERAHHSNFFAQLEFSLLPVSLSV